MHGSLAERFLDIEEAAGFVNRPPGGFSEIPGQGELVSVDRRLEAGLRVLVGSAQKSGCMNWGDRIEKR
jgi:hypothetical protein